MTRLVPLFALVLLAACSSDPGSPEEAGGASSGGSAGLIQQAAGSAGTVAVAGSHSAGSAGATHAEAGSAGLASSAGAGGAIELPAEAGSGGAEELAGAAGDGGAAPVLPDTGVFAECNPAASNCDVDLSCAPWSETAGQPDAHLCSFSCWSLQVLGPPGTSPKMAPDAALVAQCSALGGSCLGAGDYFPVCVPHAPI